MLSVLSSQISYFEFLYPKFSNSTNKQEQKINLLKLIKFQNFSADCVDTNKSSIFQIIERCYNILYPGFGAVGSAHALGARGQQFEPANPDQVTCSYDLCMSVFIFLDKTCSKNDKHFASGDTWYF